MTSQAEFIQRNHRRAVRFFWAVLFGVTAVSLVGNIAHAVLPYIPREAIQIGAAAVPPVLLLAAVHGIALAVRAGASGRVYRWAICAVALIGIGAFAVSFLALQDLMRGIGYSAQTAWVFPAIVDTGVAVSTMMLVALGDKPLRRVRTTTASVTAQNQALHRPAQSAKVQLTSVRNAQGADTGGAQRAGSTAAQVHRDPAQNVHSVHAAMTSDDADMASDLIASGATTQSSDTVIAVLVAHREGASINAAAKASGINYRTAQRIVQGAELRHLMAVS